MHSHFFPPAVSLLQASTLSVTKQVTCHSNMQCSQSLALHSRQPARVISDEKPVWEEVSAEGQRVGTVRALPII